MATATYHGLDTNSNPQSDPCVDNFYLGEMGMGTIVGDWIAVNPTLNICFQNIGDTGNTESYASWMVENGRTAYGFWFLLGPKFANPSSSSYSDTCGVASGEAHNCSEVSTTTDCYNWGVAQANAAVAAWANNYPSLQNTFTIFADVEQTASGWFTSGTIAGVEWYTLNQQVIAGFIDGINNAQVEDPSGNPVLLQAGIYTNPNYWTTIANNMSLTNYSVVLWAADWTGGSGCSPSWNPPTIGGIAATIWQYYSGLIDNVAMDYDAAMSLPS